MNRRAILFAAAFAVAGCKPAGPANVVDLTVVANATVTASAQAAARTLTVATTGVHSNTKSYALPAGFPGKETLQLLPTVTSGVLTVTVTALDKNKVPLAQGKSMVTLTGKAAMLTVTLAMVAPPTVNVTPSKAKLTVGKSTPFMADQPVRWSVMGGDANGTVDVSGNYTAPATPGTYTLVAADLMDPAATATATITVVDYGVELLIGQLGGPGELDGMGAAARFSFPQAVAVDGMGHLFVGDYAGCVLRQIDLTTFAVTTVGGAAGVCVDADGMLGTTALFAQILSLAYDPGDNTLFVNTASALALRLRRVNLTTGQVSSLADPTGTVRLSTSRGMAWDDVKKVLYEARHGNHTIVTYDLSGAMPVVAFFAGMRNTPGSADTATGPATLANFNLPAGLVFDGANLYVADEGNQTIRKIVVASGITTTIAGIVGSAGDVNGPKGTGTFSSPRGLALGQGNSTLYVAEEIGSVVRAVKLADGSVTTLSGVPYVPPASGPPTAPRPPIDAPSGATAQFGNLFGVAVNQASGALYTSDGNNHVIRQVALSNGAASTVAGTPAVVGTSDGPGATARFWYIGSMIGDGNTMYIADNGNATLRKYDLAGDMLTTIAGTPTQFGDVDGIGAAARFERPEGLFIDGNTMYIADGGDSTIRAMDLTTGAVATIAGQHLTMGFTDGTGAAARFGYPWYLTGDHSGHLYISDGESAALRMLTLATNDVVTIAGNATMFGTMDGVGTAATFFGPYGISIEGGLLYVSDHLALRSVTLDNYTVVTVAGSSVAATAIKDGVGAAAQIVSLGVLGGDGHGHVYFGDLATIRRYDVATRLVTTIVGKPYEETNLAGSLSTARVAGFSGMSFTPTGDLIYEDGAQSVVMLLRMPPGP